MSISNAVKAARKKAGLTQAELGEKLGVSGSMVGQYETGRRSPKMETLQRIADALDIHILDLTGVGEQFDKYRITVDNLPVQENVRKVFDSLSIEDKNEFWKILRPIMDVSPSPSKARLDTAYSKLNAEGQQKAVERVEELTEIPKYQCRETSPETPLEGTDTTLPESPSEGPQEGTEDK